MLSSAEGVFQVAFFREVEAPAENCAVVSAGASTSRSTTSLRSLAFFAMIIVSLSASVSAQTDTNQARFETSILDSEPFDLITLTSEWENAEVKAFPIEFPNGVVPAQPDPDSDFEVRLFLYPERRYRISWRDIAKIERYEELILDEAKRLVAARQFAPAFEHLSYLLANYPSTPGLDTMRQELLLRSAQEAIRSGSLAHALTILEEFVRNYPNSPLANQARGKISELAGQVIETYFRSGELSLARLMIDRLERDYKATPLAVVDTWKQRFRDYAETFRRKALELRDAGNFPDARVAAMRMLDIEPNIPDGRALLRDLIRAYPLVRVGVFQKSNRADATELSDWPVRRIGALVSQPLFEFRNSGPEGGSYKFSLGSFVHSDDRTEIEMRIANASQPGIPSAYELSQWMLRRADPEEDEYYPSWAAIVKEVRVDSADVVTVQLKRPHVLPHALLQWPLDELKSNLFQPSTLYVRGENRLGDKQSYRWNKSTQPVDGQPAEITETLYTDPKVAIADLMKGNIEVIDRLFPADANRLKDQRDIRVENYALPIVHMLLPLSDHPFLEDRDFRRALLYAVNRESILSEMLGNVARADSQLISGPFPIGSEENDPLSYAYNKDLKPLPFDPKLAQLLMILTKQKLAVMAEKSHTKAPELTPLRLGVPDYESARVAGQACVQQWAVAGIPAQLIVLDAEQFATAKQHVDLLYLSAALWEPAIDAERLFGEAGIAASDNIFIVQVLANLRTANNWREVRQFCQDLHALVYAHLPVLPLWQVGESFAYRSILQGVARRPVTLYQDVARWRLSLGE